MKALCMDITKVAADAIVNAANGFSGIMGGGVAAAIKRAGGREIELEAVAICSKGTVPAGSVYITQAGRLPFRYVFHAVTQDRPGQQCRTEIVEACLQSIFAAARELECKTIVMPGLGTKIGRLSYDQAAEVYNRLIPWFEKQCGIEVTVCDVDAGFIDLLVSDGLDNK